MGTISILDFRLIIDAEGQAPSGKANSILSFYVKTMVNVSQGESIQVRTKIDNIQTANPPWQDSTADRDYVNEIVETNGQVQFDSDTSFSPISGHTFEIVFLNYTNKTLNFYTQSENNTRPLIIIAGVGGSMLARFLIYRYIKRKQ